MRRLAQNTEIDKRIAEARARAELEASIEPSLNAALDRVPEKLREIKPEARDQVLVIVSSTIDASDTDGPNVPKILVSPRLVGRPHINPVAAWSLGDLQMVAYDRAEYAEHFNVEYARGRFCRTSGIDWADWLAHKPGSVVCLMCSQSRFLGGRRVN